METGNTYNIWKCMIEEIKRNYNIKQVDLANIIGVEQSTISGWKENDFKGQKWESGRILLLFWYMGKMDINNSTDFIEHVSRENRLNEEDLKGLKYFFDNSKNYDFKMTINIFKDRLKGLRKKIIENNKIGRESEKTINETLIGSCTEKSVERELECSEDTKKEGPEVSEKFVEKELECSEEVKEDSLEVSKESVEKELECSEDTKKEGLEVSEKFVEKELECSEDTQKEGPEVSEKSVEKELECSEDTQKEGPEVSEKSVEREREAPEKKSVENVEEKPQIRSGDADIASKEEKDHILAKGWYQQYKELCKKKKENKGDQIEALKNAAKYGHTRAMYKLGLHYKNGDGISQDYDQAMRWFFEAALRKDVDALWELACGYKRSRETPNNYEKGRILQRIAADHGQMFANIAESAFKKLENTKKRKRNIRNYWTKLSDNTQKNDEEKKFIELIKIWESNDDINH